METIISTSIFTERYRKCLWSGTYVYVFLYYEFFSLTNTNGTNYLTLPHSFLSAIPQSSCYNFPWKNISPGVCPWFSLCLDFVWLKTWWGRSPGQAAQLVTGSSRYTKVAGSIPRQGTYKKQPMMTSLSGTTNWCLSLSLSLCLWINK